MKTFEFVPGDEIVIAPGRTVKRIRAVVAIIARGVVPGQLGGYVEHETQVSENARVFGDARVYGDARVSGNAWVSNDHQVWWVSKVGRDNGTLTAYKLKDGSIELTRGCFRGSIDEFLSQLEKEHDDTTRIEYQMLIEVAVSRLTRFD